MNYVLVEPQGHRIFYSHWGGQSVDRDAFWGPVATQRFVQSQRPIDYLLDDIWAEGGLLLDTVRRELALWGGEEIHADVPLRHLYMEMLAVMWPGWRVRWAHEGALDLARAIGVPDELVLARDPKQESGIGGPAAPALIRTLATIARPERPLAIHALGSTIAKTLLFGPAVLDQMDARRDTGPHERLEVPWDDGSWWDGGVHVDVAQRTLAFWSVRDLSDRRRIAEAWPGWTITYRGDRYEEHLTETGGRVVITPPPREQLLATLREILMRGLDRPSPAHAIAAHLAGKHERVEINPHALADHCGPEIGDGDRREILDRLFEKLRT